MWAVVADAIKSMALSSQVKDVDCVEVETFDNEADALVWPGK